MIKEPTKPAELRVMALPSIQGREMEADALTRFIDMMEASVNRLDDLNKSFPQLATPITKDTVTKTRNFVTDLQKSVARHVLAEHGLDDTLNVLARQFKIRINALQIFDFVGEDAYRQALRREAHDFAANLISPQQTAKLWNELGRQPLGDEIWTEQGVLELLKKPEEG